MRKIFFFWLLMSFSVASLAEERYHLARILVNGSQRYRSSDVVAAIGLKENSVVTRQELDDSVKRLSDSGVFSSVQYSFRPAAARGSIEAEFQVKDTDKLLPAEFENFIWWPDPELATKLHKAVPLYLGQIPLSGNLADQVAAALAAAASEKLKQPKVVWQQWAAPGELPSAYRFRITDGLGRIQSVQLTGADHLPQAAFARFVSSLNNHDFLRSDVNKAIDRILIPAYQERGYSQAKLREIQVNLTEENALFLSVAFDEGTQFKLSSYSWTGNKAASAEQLSRFVSLRGGEPINIPALQLNLEEARKFFGKFGLQAATITPIPTYSGETVSYEFHVNEGETYRMGDLDVQGLDGASSQKVRDFWKLAPGSPYDNTYARNFVSHLVMRKPGSTSSFSCEFLEQEDDAQKVVNVQLRFTLN